jgi:hypothetical protein
MRVPDSILRCVAFIGVPKGATKTQLEYRATGFFLEMRSEFDSDTRFRYFVTAAHVAKNIYDGKFSIRLNSGFAFSAFEVDGEELGEWWFHPDKSVDVAVIPWFPDEPVAHEPIPAAMILPDNAIKQGGWLGVGDEVMIAGLFTRFRGKLRNWPIVRIGNIAMLPDEKHKTELGEAYIYLVEARSMGGLSGSPVFARETAYIDRPAYGGETKVIAGGGVIFLLGLIHGHQDNKSRPNETINMGIAEVTPAERILEVLQRPELVKMRKAAFDEKSQQETATMDMAVGNPTQKTRAKNKHDRIDIPIPTEKQFFGDLKKVMRRKPPQSET